ncbi:MAG: hypothetical protein FJZ05_02345 [Candidatus Nealsonbacteria bacterium]|nr:hypothetical protein [Candidatus Nealsonbacteria bacterium]
MPFNYYQICEKLLKTLPEKQKDVLLKRFALDSKQAKKGQTLEAIGKQFGITRERVRQIETDAFSRLEPESKKDQKVFQYFKSLLKKTGNLRKEEAFLYELASAKFQNQVYFLLTLSEDFIRFGETRDFYSFWATDRKTWVSLEKAISLICQKLKKAGKPLKLKEINNLSSLKPEVLNSYLEISKKIQKNAKGLFGLKDWPEINPKRIKDKAFLAFKEVQKPLHFGAVANLVGQALPQTVHNELIKDPRFVLVGRGIYALKEWGYEPGMVKDVIMNVLKTAGKPLKKEEIIVKTLKQRMVKENTVLLNLSNKKYFLKTQEGRYTIREA